MTYSQKYTLVQFFQQTAEGEVFPMTQWPLHITLADIFAVDRTDELMRDLQQYIDTHPLARSSIKKETTLGTTNVWLLENTTELYAMHSKFIDILEQHGAIFNNPQFTREGFLPHITIQPGEDMHIGDTVEVSVASLIDMFPDHDWQQRRVIKHFSPDSK